MLPNTTCYPACRPIHHHAVYHIAELNMLHSIPLNTSCCPTQQPWYPACRQIHHHAVNHTTQLNILPPNWPLNTKCCPLFRWSQHSAKQTAQRSILPIMCLNPTCCPTNYPNQYAVQHAGRLAAQHNLENYVDCCFCISRMFLSLITHDYRLSLIFFALCFVLF
jgi:hypothetical protein